MPREILKINAKHMIDFNRQVRLPILSSSSSIIQLYTDLEELK